MRYFLGTAVAFMIGIVTSLVFTLLKNIFNTSGFEQSLENSYGTTGLLIAVVIQLLPLLIGVWFIKVTWKKITHTPQKDNNNQQSSDASLAKAVYNHSKDIASEIKPAINTYKEKHQVTKNNNNSASNTYSNENEIYEQALKEIEEKIQIKSIWAKALAQSDGDTNKANSIYIQLRVNSINEDLTKEKQYDNDKTLDQKKISEKKNTNESIGSLGILVFFMLLVFIITIMFGMYNEFLRS